MLRCHTVVIRELAVELLDEMLSFFWKSFLYNSWFTSSRNLFKHLQLHRDQIFSTTNQGLTNRQPGLTSGLYFILTGMRFQLSSRMIDGYSDNDSRIHGQPFFLVFYLSSLSRISDLKTIT